MRRTTVHDRAGRTPGLIALGWALLAALAFATVACSHWREAYLDDGIGQATQDQILEKFGPPHMRKDSLLDGDSVWTYRFAMTERELHPWSPGSVGRGVTDLSNAAASIIGKGGEAPKEELNCYRYELKFDRSKTLREWKREECRGPEGSATP